MKTIAENANDFVDLRTMGKGDCIYVDKTVDNSRIAKNMVYLYIRMIFGAPKNGGYYPISAAHGRA